MRDIARNDPDLQRRSQFSELLSKLIPIDLKDATPQQRAELRVNVKDTRSKLAKQRVDGLRQWRSKYVPHEGKKEQARKP